MFGSDSVSLITWENEKSIGNLACHTDVKINVAFSFVLLFSLFSIMDGTQVISFLVTSFVLSKQYKWYVCSYACV